MAVVLHFSGYGYQKRGVPLWLVEGLRFWARRARTCRLLPFFHELYASGRPWQSSSGYPRCRNTLRSILNLSSLAITPTDLYRKRLSRLRKDSAIKITAMPVFSNVGEPSCVAPHGHVAPLLLSSALLGCRVVLLAFIVHKPNASSQRWY
jgi:hypothetical protein